MIFTVKEINNAVKALENIEPRLAKELSRIAEEARNDDYYPVKDRNIELINRKSYFATILWSKEDIKCALKENGYDITDDNICQVINELSISDMEDCSQGWEMIEKAIDDCKGRLEIENELES